MNGSMQLFFQERLKKYADTNSVKNYFLFIQNKVLARELRERIFDRSALIQMFLSSYA